MIKKNARFNYLILIYISGIILFTLFRIAETIAYCSKTEGPDDFDGLYGHALWIGFRFDAAVSGFVMILPLVLMIIGEMACIHKRAYYAVIHYLLMVLYTICFFACAADIPYFCFFFNRLDVVALSWSDSPGVVFDMIISDPEYLFYLGVFVAVSVGWWLLGRLFYKHVLITNLDQRMPYTWSIPESVILVALVFLGMRGLEKRPINTVHAYFSSNPFINQIGLNPVFSFEKSLEELGKEENMTAKLIDAATAHEVLNELRNMPEDNSLPEASLQVPEGMNVVLVLMESMTVNKTALYNPETSLTPCLDSLMERSLTFTDMWSAGIHTYNGIYSTLYSHPAILARHTMKHSTVPNMCGLPQALEALGYRTAFFLTHKPDFDNMIGFLPQNGYERVVSLMDYPADEPRGAYGIPDHLLFDHALQYCDSIAAKGEPFLTTVLTCSDHSPFFYPEGIDFTPRHKEIEKRMTEYADWSIGRFMSMAKKRDWFNNTLFVFIADHGEALQPVYEMPLSYNHIPMLIYAPKQLTPLRVDRLAMQIDAAPTIMGLMGIEPPKNILGINLLNHVHKYAYFSADDKIGVVNGEWFYLYQVKLDRGSLYRYRMNSTVDCIEQYPELAEDMKRYAFSMIQSSQQMLLDRNTHCNR